MKCTETDELVRGFVSGDEDSARSLLAHAATCEDPQLLVAAALVALHRAAAVAATTRDRQLVAIAEAHLAGDADRVGVLARDHLSDHPDNLLVAWIVKEQS